MTEINIEGKALPLKNLDKVIFSSIGAEKTADSAENGAFTVTRADIISYYSEAAKYILPHIYDKPFSMLHFPSGVGGDSFYQKECPALAPEWLKTVALKSNTRGSIRWCLVNDLPSMIYMAGRNVIEMHTWFSRLPDLSRPDVAVIDLDPSGETGFKEAAFIADAFGTLLKELNLFSVVKTTGSRGIHIYIPVKDADFVQVKAFLDRLCFIITSTYPRYATTQRAILRRGDRVYLDAVQNGEGKTIAAPYSLRVRDGLPVSMPLDYSELKTDILPRDFNIRNALKRLSLKGDLFEGFYQKRQTLPKL